MVVSPYTFSLFSDPSLPVARPVMRFAVLSGSPASLAVEKPTVAVQENRPGAFRKPGLIRVDQMSSIT
jgi:hypothetical protein